MVKRVVVFTWILALLGLSTLSAFALERGKDGYFHTGDGVRVKKIAFIKLKIYRISHDMRELPAVKSKQGVIDADVDKRLGWMMLRDAGGERLKDILRDSFDKNGYRDGHKIEPFLAAFAGGLHENDRVSIDYDAASKTTTLKVPRAAAVSLPGTDFMRAVWSIWFGKSDAPELGDALISKL